MNSNSKSNENHLNTTLSIRQIETNSTTYVHINLNIPLTHDILLEAK